MGGAGNSSTYLTFAVTEGVCHEKILQMINTLTQYTIGTEISRKRLDIKARIQYGKFRYGELNCLRDPYIFDN